MATRLSTIFEKYAVSTEHAEEYDAMLKVARDMPVRLLQIDGTDTLLMAWSEYFSHPLTTINGLLAGSPQPNSANLGKKVHVFPTADFMMVDPLTFGYFDIIVHAATNNTSPDVFTGVLEKWADSIKEGGVLFMQNVQVGTPGLNEDFVTISGNHELSYAHDNSRTAVFIKRA